MNHADPNRSAELARNVAVALRFKQSQGTKEMPQVEREVLAPGYNRVRGGNFHLAGNARGEGWPEPALYLRAAFPDRVDVIEQVIAEGDRVGLLFRVTATHTGNFFGIPPTGKRVDVYEVALLRIVNGQMVEGWFMMDEVGLLQQLGVKIPVRKDGRSVAPPLATGGEDPDVLLRRLESQQPAAQKDRNRVVAVRSKSSRPDDDRAVDYARLRAGFQHLHDYGVAHGTAARTLNEAFPDRQDRIDLAIAEGDQVWMRFNVSGTHKGNLFGIPPTGRQVGVPEVAIMRIQDGRLKSSWYFGDELGMLLQLGCANALLGS